MYSLVATCSGVKSSLGVCQYATASDSVTPGYGIAYPNVSRTLSSSNWPAIQLCIARIFCSASGSSPSKSTTTVAEFTAPSGHFSSMCSKPTLVSSSGGSASLDAMEKSACKKGNPAPSRIINVGISTAHGLSITVFAIFDQIPSPSSLSVLNANGILYLNSLCPSIARTAGKTIIENIIATETAKVPPIPKLGRPVFSKNNIPIRPIATVTPLKNTALPAVATVIAVEILISLPRLSSSLNLLTMNKE